MAWRACSSAWSGRTRFLPTQLRDLRSATKRVADPLGNEPAAITLDDLGVIAAGLSAIRPIAGGMTPKRFSTIRSDFLAAVKASRVMPVEFEAAKTFTPAWTKLFERLSGRRAHIGLSRLARYASAKGIEPKDINDAAIDGFIAAVHCGSLHQHVNALHRQVTLIWNKAARDRKTAIPVGDGRLVPRPSQAHCVVATSSFVPTRRGRLFPLGRQVDPFAVDARPRALAPRTIGLRRNQIHAAVAALINSGVKPATIRSLADLFTPPNFKSILQRRLEIVGGGENAFNKDLGSIMVLIAREWAKVEGAALVELKRLVTNARAAYGSDPRKQSISYVSSTIQRP